MSIRRILLFFCSGLTVALHAQSPSDGPSAVPDSIRAEVLHNLELAKTYQLQVPKSISKIDKHHIQYCNTGTQSKEDANTRAEDCVYASIWTNDGMALYKSCLFDLEGSNCLTIANKYLPETLAPGYSQEIAMFRQSQGDEFALAVFEWAPNCRGECLTQALRAFAGPAATGEQIPGLRQNVGTHPSLLVLQRADVIRLLSRACLEQGIDEMCPSLAQLGVAITPDAVARAKAVQADFQRLADIQDADLANKQADLRASEQQHRDNRNALVGALDDAAAAQRTNSTPSLSSPVSAENLPAGATAPSMSSVAETSCKDMSRCVKVTAAYVEDGCQINEQDACFLHVVVKNVCDRAIRITNSANQVHRSCTYSQTWNAGPGESQDMGMNTTSTRYVIHADDNVSSGTTGQGCPLLVPSDCE